MKTQIYLYRSGKKAKRVKTIHTTEDILILKLFYEKHIKHTELPEFENVDYNMRAFMANSYSFAQFRLNYRWNEFKQAIKTTIKNFFQWKRTYLKD